jgi:tetratricopeptide (TPR) repeat protein
LEAYIHAIETHNTIINLIPDNPEFIAERGLTYHMLKDKDMALADFNKAVMLDTENPYRYSSRAFIKDFYGDHEGAVKDYRKTLELDPDDAIALNNLGIIEEKLGRYDKAKENFDRSDKLTGVNDTLSTLGAQTSERSNGATKSKMAPESGWQNFIKTLKALFSSRTERQAFFKFLAGKKK